MENVLPGTYSVSISDLPKGTYLEGVRDGERDVSQNTLTVDPQYENSLRVVLGSGAGVVRGRVADATGAAVPSAVVALVSQDSQKPYPTVATRADAEGWFELECAPGEYSAYAWFDVDFAAYKNRVFISQFSERAIKVTIAAQEERTISLTALRLE
jgi:hypothetical protein